MDFVLEDSDVSEEELLKQREAKKQKAEPTSVKITPLHITAAHPPQYKMPKWNPTKSKAIVITPQEFHARREEAQMTREQITTEMEKWDEMGPPDVGYRSFLLDMRVGGKRFAQLKRDLWRGEKSITTRRMPHTWMMNRDYVPSRYEEYKYGSILDAEWIVAYCGTTPLNIASQAVTVFSGKKLSIFPNVSARHWAWNPKYADKQCWNHLHLALDRWEYCEQLGKELHEEGCTMQCTNESCNCFIEGKHSSFKQVYYVPDQLFKGTRLWFKDASQEDYYVREAIVQSKNGDYLVLPEYSSLVGPIGY